MSVEHTSLLVAFCLYTLVWIFFATNFNYPYFTQCFTKFQKLWTYLQCKFSNLVEKSWYQSIMQFIILNTETVFPAAVKNSFDMPDVDKSRTCVLYVLKTIYFTNVLIWSFSNKYIHKKLFRFPSTKAIFKK